MGGQVIDEELQQELEDIAASVECELYHVRFAGNRLQIFLDRPDGGVNLEHCQSVSRQVSALLDVHDFGKKRYYLEVSSPGLDRELFTPRDYKRFLGHLASVTFTNSDGRKETITGRLQDWLDPQNGDNDAASGALLLEPEKTDKTLRIPHTSIRTARLEVEI